MSDRAFYLAVGLLVALIVVMVWSLPSSGHEAGEEFAPYYGSLRTHSGGSCCGDVGHHDCGPVPARRTAEGWQAQHDGAWIDVPAEAVLARPNPVGEAVLCWNFGRVLCFVPTSET